MFSLLQARSVFNPLPLTKDHKVELVPQVQAIMKDAYRAFLNSSTEGQRAQCHGLIKQLGSRKTQGLWLDQGLEEQTSLFWKAHVEASEC